MQQKNKYSICKIWIKSSIFLLIFLISASVQSQSIYPLKIDSIGNSKEIPFSTFQGKKILLVNAAILDTGYYQWRELRQLQSQYSNQLVVVISPFNNFNDQTLTSFFQGGNYSFIISKRVNTYNTSDSLFDWLSSQSKNGLRDTYVNVAFQKYLINENGNLIAVFGAKTSPMSKTVRDAIEL